MGRVGSADRVSNSPHEVPPRRAAILLILVEGVRLLLGVVVPAEPGVDDGDGTAVGAVSMLLVNLGHPLVREAQRVPDIGDTVHHLPHGFTQRKGILDPCTDVSGIGKIIFE